MKKRDAEYVEPASAGALLYLVRTPTRSKPFVCQDHELAQLGAECEVLGRAAITVYEGDGL